MGRFPAQWDPLVLLYIAGEVLRAADADQPDAVTQRAYNEAREAVGFANSPRADKLAARFGVPWARFTRTIVMEKHPARELAKAHDKRTAEWRSDTEIASALRAAAAWLGTDHLNPNSYERAREEMHAVAEARHMHGRAVEPLPSAQAIRWRRPFAEAVVAAGLAVTPARRTLPMPRRMLVVLFIEHCDFVPGYVQLMRFAKLHRIRLADRSDDEPHAVVIEVAREHFAKLGRPLAVRTRGMTPDDAEARMARSSPALRKASAAYPATRPRWDLDGIRVAITKASDLLDPGEPLTLGRYEALADLHPDLPGPAQIVRTARKNGTSWAALVRAHTAARAEALREHPTNAPLRTDE